MNQKSFLLFCLPAEKFCGDEGRYPVHGQGKACFTLSMDRVKHALP